MSDIQWNTACSYCERLAREVQESRKRIAELDANLKAIAALADAVIIDNTVWDGGYLFAMGAMKAIIGVAP